ncbi:hypothetical protein P6F26_09240 [Roseibacterium sp. SDUM158017]|uniref:MotE family protein n=1 Tax=Roseicyclus salinarum TaxID=3036773 RepID=UPI00241537A0|nr:hypothetical protein [Roseibacterium sp. SDUM158017]MDG4648630.1 hypothetical protein [Roseibacterium sp. SDUM158017]
MTHPVRLPLMLAAVALGAGPCLAGGVQPAKGALPPYTATKQSQTPPMCSTSEDVFASIAEERALLEEQQADLAARRAALDLARGQLEAEAEQLAEVRNRVEALLEQVEAARTADLQRLVNLYRNMKPDEAAAIMDDLDMEVTFMILATMSERDAAPILAQLDPMRARALSRIILERSQLPGDQNVSNLRLR